MSRATLQFKDIGDGAVEIIVRFEGENGEQRDPCSVLTPAESAALFYFESQFPEFAEGMKTKH